ncbi:hypothetical protein Trco_006224 [Trichoderma cornu-damae]|uniref:Uncharacterized protein n=1 Tax=Trichoderma cornu-damae TaxID=654480 RepID=A0A9P8QL22_9HYPO|nr:hypothetical protein Trco_006224 [Trichoderma cornu-damae]
MDFQHFAPQIDRFPQPTPKEVASIAYWNTIRDNFTISTWIAIGAILQGLLVVFVRPTVAIAPAALVLFSRFSRAMLAHFGIIRNTQMDGVLMGKYTVQMPNEDGSAPSESADKGIAVIMLGANGFMTCCYFRSVEDIHRFAHSPVHREGWNWWNSFTDSNPHLSIMHEVYSAPKKNWENIFINYHLTGIGA